MSKKFVLTIVICSFWLDASLPEGTQLSKCKFVQGKSCDTEQMETGQYTREQKDHWWLNSANLDRKLKSSSRAELSPLKVGEPAAIFINSLHQQRQQQLLEKQRMVSSGYDQRLQHDYYRPTFHKPVVKLQQQHDSPAYKSQQFRQSPRHMTIVERTKKSEPNTKSKPGITRFRTQNGNEGASETFNMVRRSANPIRHRISNSHPNMISSSHDKKTEMLYFNSQGNKYGKLLTESTTIYPFIATRQALDYLTSYDSKPRPRRWPLRLILPETENITAIQDKADVSGIGSFIAGHTQEQWVRRRQNRHSRSTVNILQPGNKDELRDELVHEGQGKTMGTLIYGNITMSEDNMVGKDFSDNTQRQGIIKVTNDNTHDIRRQKTAGSISIDDETARQGDRKRKNRRRQQQQKRNKKSSKRKRQGNQRMSDRNVKTTEATNNFSQIPPVDPVHLLLAKNVFQTFDDEQIVKNTSNDQNKATEFNLSQLMQRESLSILTPQTRTSDNWQILQDCLFNQTSEQCIQSERLGTPDADDRTDLMTSQTTRKQRQLVGNIKKSQSNKGKSRRKSKNLNVSIQTEKSTDNHMFVSLQPDLSTTTFLIPAISKTTPTETGVKGLLENHSKISTEVSSDNTRQRVSDTIPPAHVPAHTNSGLHIQQVVTSSETWPFSQTDWTTDNYRATKDIYRSKGEHSGVKEMSQSPPMSVQNKVATVNEIITTGEAENIVMTLRNFSLTSSSLTTTMPQHDVRSTQLSSAGFWKTRLRKTKGEIQNGEDGQHEKNSKNSKYNNDKNKRRTSLSRAFQKSDSSATKLPPNKAPDGEKGNEENPENSPFIGYKTAYDFLSHQKGPKTNIHSEARREANELNRFMGEGMCEIFNKHYVPTRIGGKCE